MIPVEIFLALSACFISCIPDFACTLCFPVFFSIIYLLIYTYNSVILSYEYESFSVELSIPLPPWVLEEVRKNPDLAYTDKAGRRNSEYISLGADNVPALKGRTPVQCYADFMRSFRDNFDDFLGDFIVVCS